MRARRFAPVPTLSIVTYHHIADDDPDYPYDRGVADASPAQFRRQIETLARYGTPIGVDELVGALDGEPLPANAVMVTFDDGYRSCHDVALPILKSVGVRATFFIPTAFITERRLYWWERLALAISRRRRERAQLTYPHAIEIDATSPRALKQLTDLIKDSPGLDVDRFVDETTAALGVLWGRASESAMAENLVMSWDQIRALAAAGMDVESHTRRHRVLQTLDDAALTDELVGSRTELETQIGRPVRAVAYPVGRRIVNEPRIREAVAAAGYRVGLTNASGVNRMWPLVARRLFPIDPLDVSRLSTDRSMSDAMFLTQVAIPRLAYLSTHNI
jgi:peptidoglycan/xylan/chitin deacetylase (PgdA/CDA1 family)